MSPEDCRLLSRQVGDRLYTAADVLAAWGLGVAVGAILLAPALGMIAFLWTR